MDENNAFISNLPAGQVIQDVRAGMGPAGRLVGLLATKEKKWSRWSNLLMPTCLTLTLGDTNDIF